MKQKIISADSASAIEHDLNIAIGMGWIVKQIVCNSETNKWIALLEKPA